MRTLFCSGLGLAAWLGWVALASADDSAPGLTDANAHAPVALPRRTSIILIEGHGIGFGDLSCYGQTNFQTPNLDRLAAGGIRFDHYTAGAGTNYEGQAWLMTGSKAPGMPEKTTAQMLKDAGYSTGYIGEWLQTGQPWELGFDEFAGFLQPNEGVNYYSSYMWRFSPSTIYRHTAGKEPIYPNNGGVKGESTVDFFFKMAMNYVRLEAPARSNHHRPFFLVINLPAPRSAKPGADVFPVNSDAPYSDEPWPQAAKNRAALVARLDDDIGRLFEQLGEVGMTNNVAIFFTSSAPPEKFADPQLNFFHAANDITAPAAGVEFESPMLVYWPQHIPAGQASDHPWSAVDFLPTTAEIAFLKPPGNVDGRSVMPWLLGQKTQ